MKFLICFKLANGKANYHLLYINVISKAQIYEEFIKIYLKRTKIIIFFTDIKKMEILPDFAEGKKLKNKKNRQNPEMIQWMDIILKQDQRSRVSDPKLIS